MKKHGKKENKLYTKTRKKDTRKRKPERKKYISSSPHSNNITGPHILNDNVPRYIIFENVHVLHPS
jgi:hypothetical protein